MAKRKTKDSTEPKTLYLDMIDEAALAALVELAYVGMGEVDLPRGELDDGVKPRFRDQCNLCRAKGSAAAYMVLEGLLETEAFEGGRRAGGTQYLPVAACHDRMYETAIVKLADVVSGYDQVVARRFLKGQSRGSIANVGHLLMEVYDEGDWCGFGHVSENLHVWEIVKEPETLDAPDEPEADSGDTESDSA